MEEQIVAYCCLYNRCEDIQPSRMNELNAELPNKLVVTPGEYMVFGRAYSMAENGLYRFIRFSEGNVSSEQRIVYGGGKVDDLMSAISWITVHGVQDEGLSNQDKTIKAMHGKVSCKCGCISLWVSTVLESIGVKSRCVTGLTLDSWNTYDNGHTMLEVYIKEENKWACYDIDNHRTFYISSNHLTICELCNAVSNGEYEVCVLSGAAVHDTSDLNIWGEKLLGEGNLSKWYKRVLQVPLIRYKNRKYYFCDKRNRKMVEGYSNSYRFINEDRFYKRFYL